MAKPILKFTAVPYEIGDFKGYRPQLEAQQQVSDLDFCREVVTEKRLAMSAEELLHALEMVGEVGPQKVAEDGRPRAITNLLKWNRFAQGKLESPTSPWNDSCKAVIRAQLLNDAEKLIDASFTNVNTGIGVKLDNVTWIGAKSVQNAIIGLRVFRGNGTVFVTVRIQKHLCGIPGLCALLAQFKNLIHTNTSIFSG